MHVTLRLAAENLFLRKQLSFYAEREPTLPERITRFTMATPSRLFEWKNALVVVKPDTLIRGHLLPTATGFRAEGEPTSRFSVGGRRLTGVFADEEISLVSTGVFAFPDPVRNAIASAGD